MKTASHFGRRQAILGIAQLLTIFPQSGLSQTYKPTPTVSMGPFYPPSPTGLPFISVQCLSPLPTGNDLTRSASGQRAEGAQININGRIMNTFGQPIAGAKIEIWQVDNRGYYIVETGANLDPGFTGYGSYITGDSGEYLFRTIQPGSYTRYGGLIKRTKHIHVRVEAPRYPVLTTEIWFDGEPHNQMDTFIRRITDQQIRARMLIKLSSSENGITSGWFDVVLSESR